MSGETGTARGHHAVRSMLATLRAPRFVSSTIGRPLLTSSEPRAIQQFAGFERIGLSAIAADRPYGLFVRQQTIENAPEQRLVDVGRTALRPEGCQYSDQAAELGVSCGR
ncbi:hypothetical protein ABZS86_36645 [Streptomyces sp. NPDC005355]|uniref:hypothetical protein n=1 Tax=Streptomyces sp. NPDC005355 TaxID=3157038 RepID=UPI0033B34C65